VFQDPLSSLHPQFTIGWQIAEAIRAHSTVRRDEAWKRAVSLLDEVGISEPARRIGDYPHQFSGGMRQRVMIAMALALDPEVLIADEPTTALDVTVQAQIMALLSELQRQRNMGLILITHDMGVVADVADRISVMYAGKVVEEAPVYDIYARPAHPYTKGLLESIPRLDRKGQELSAIRGLPPMLTAIPPGCSFHPRCDYAQDICRRDAPDALPIAPHRVARCHFAKEVIGD
jgi:oligopeptide transport system ATP-binding protein